MNDQVTISIPPKTEYLKAAAIMLNAMAEANGEIIPGIIDETVVKTPGAPTPGAPTPGAPTPGADLDTEGIRWDARIHASTQKKIKDGTWRIKKGADSILVTTVKAELKLEATETPAPGIDTSTVDPAPIMTAKAAGQTYEAFIAQGWTDAQLVEQGYMVASVPAINFSGLMDIIQDFTNKGHLSPITVNQMLSRHGVANLPALVSKPELVPAIAAEIRALCQE